MLHQYVQKNFKSTKYTSLSLSFYQLSFAHSPNKHVCSRTLMINSYTSSSLEHLFTPDMNLPHRLYSFKSTVEFRFPTFLLKHCILLFKIEVLFSILVPAYVWTCKNDLCKNLESIQAHAEDVTQGSQTLDPWKLRNVLCGVLSH